MLLGLKDVCKRKLTSEEKDTEESRLVNQLKGLDKRVKQLKKIFSKQYIIISWCRGKN